jgi:hypothetical protein
MKKSIVLIVTIILSAQLLSCGGKSDTPAPVDSTKAPPSAHSTKPEGAKFGIKAGIAEGTMEMMGQKAQIKMYFDDYGAKMYNETSGDMMGQKMHQISITIDTTSYVIDMVQKTGQIIKAKTDDMNFANMTPQELLAKGITEVGKATLLGRECKIYEIDPNVNVPKDAKAPRPETPDTKGKFWIWNNFPLKMEMGAMMKMEITKLDETSPAPSVFEVPKDVTMTEM